MRERKYVVDFTDVNYYLEMHAVIMYSLEFPDYYGCNWDAFWDCLTDMYGGQIYIKIIGIEVIERKFGEEAEIMIGILKEFKHFNKDLFSDSIKIEILRENGVVETIE